MEEYYLRGIEKMRDRGKMEYSLNKSGKLIQF